MNLMVSDFSKRINILTCHQFARRGRFVLFLLSFEVELDIEATN